MNTIVAMVETPKGSANKYNFDPENRYFKLSKVMPAGMVFPYDFGFIPDTKGEDGDPVDIIIISELKSFPGCVMDCRIIGAITANQTEGGKTVRNDRLLAIPEVSQMFTDVKSISDLPTRIVKQIEGFFINYNHEAGKKFIPLGRIDAARAFKMIKQQ